MSGISSKIGTFAIAKQSAKGSPATTPTSKFYFSSAPTLAPTKERGRLSRTDGSRDAGPGYTSSMGGSGDVEVHAHPDALGLLFGAVLGANADSGSSPNFTHTLTPANDGMWVTVWRMVGSTIFERFEDCKISSIRLTGSAGNPLTVAMSIVASKVTFLAADTALAAVTSSPFIYYEAVSAIKFDTVAYPISSLDFSIDNNFSPFQADDVYISDIDPGARDVSLSAGLRFGGATALPLDYRTYYYGSPGATAQSAAVGTHAFEVTFTRNANLSLDILLPQVTWAAVPVQPDPGGDPIGVDLSCQVEKPSASPIVTVTVKDQNTTIQ